MLCLFETKWRLQVDIQTNYKQIPSIYRQAYFEFDVVRERNVIKIHVTVVADRFPKARRHMYGFL